MVSRDHDVSLDATQLGCDATVLDGLARLALNLRRAGYRLVLRNASPELIELIDLSGLAETLPTSSL
jgi:anti-anti-sigma regulatory factor